MSGSEEKLTWDFPSEDQAAEHLPTGGRELQL
jgi:hypothetical protein